MKQIAVISSLALLLAAGCTWVEPSPQARNVIVLDKARVGGCKQLGKTDVSVADKLGFVERVDEDVEHDLAVLARNEGAKMGGDTVAPLTPVKNGKRSFGVYRCINGQPQPEESGESQDQRRAKTIPYGDGG